LESGYQNATSCAGELSHINQFQGIRTPKKFRIIQSSGMIPHVDQTDSTKRK
jgi:hypothetical protein